MFLLIMLEMLRISPACCEILSKEFSNVIAISSFIEKEYSVHILCDILHCITYTYIYVQPLLLILYVIIKLDNVHMYMYIQ